MTRHQRPTPALTRCHQCPAMYDATSRECPHCGAPNQTHERRL